MRQCRILKLLKCGRSTLPTSLFISLKKLSIHAPLPQRLRRFHDIQRPGFRSQTVSVHRVLAKAVRRCQFNFRCGFRHGFFAALKGKLGRGNVRRRHTAEVLPLTSGRGAKQEENDGPCQNYLGEKKRSPASVGVCQGAHYYPAWECWKMCTSRWLGLA